MNIDIDLLKEEEAKKGWQPYYIAYAASRNMTCSEVMAADEVRWPGGCMVGYICWNRDRWYDFAKETGKSIGYLKTKEVVDEFERWLFDWAKKEANSKEIIDGSNLQR